jgi:glycine cleavage system aminomethyltransferase T
VSQFIPLPERRLLIVAGKDAAHFLHNLLTANIETLKPGQMRPAALLTPQGKIIAEMLVANAGEEGDAEGLFLLDVASGFADALLEKALPYLEKSDELNPGNLSTLQTLKQIYTILKDMDKLQAVNDKIRNVTQ